MGIFRKSIENSDSKTTPVLVDILGSDMETSLLPPNIRFLFHVNPKNMNISYTKVTSIKQSYGGYVEFVWGDGITNVSFENASGGFVRLFTGLSGVTNDSGQGRRQTLAYETMLDYLALFHFNGDIYDSRGNIAQKGFVKITFEPGIYIGWFNGNLSFTQTSESPFQVSFSSTFTVHKEVMTFRS